MTGIELVSLGTLNSAVVIPREVYKGAILIGAAGIILVHNHPSGNCRPSQEDLDISKRLYRVGKIIGIDLLDHMIVAQGPMPFYSIRQKHPEIFKESAQRESAVDLQ